MIKYEKEVNEFHHPHGYKADQIQEGLEYIHQHSESTKVRIYGQHLQHGKNANLLLSMRDIQMNVDDHQSKQRKG